MAGVEVLGAVASVAQLAAVSVCVIRSLSVLLSQMSDAPESILRRKLDIEQLLQVTSQVERCPNLQTAPISSILSSLSNEVEELKGFLVKMSPTAKDSKGKTYWKTLSWTKREKQVLSMFTKLEEKKTLLTLCVAVIDAEQRHLASCEISKVRDGVGDALKELLAIHDTTAKLVKNLGDLPGLIHTLRDMGLHDDRLVYPINNEMTLNRDLSVGSRRIDSIQRQILLSENVINQSEPQLQKRRHLVPVSELGSSASERKEVVERVCRSNENLSARSIVNNLPSSRLSDFIDRKELLEAVDLALSQSESVPKSVVLIGMGGSGKTQLAIKYCQLRSSHGTTILWADASNEESLKRSFGVLAEMISKSLNPMKTFADTNSRVCYVKEVLQTMLQQWIIVFDNYDVPSAFENIFEFFPTFHNGEIIVTSRHPDSSRLGATINVSGMHEEEALELLLRRTSLKRTSENERYATIIVRRFGHLPLAIDQAGSYIRKQRLPLCDFTEHYNQQRRNVLNYTPLLWEYRKRLSGEEGESRLSVFTTWDLAFQQLEARKKSKEMKLIMLAGFLHHSSISEELFQAHYKNSYVSKDSRTNCQETASTSPGLAIEQQSWIEHFIDEENNWNSLKFRDTIIELHDLYLIQEFSSGLHVPCRFSLHPLVSDWIKLRGPGDQSQYYTKEAIHIVTSFLGSQFYSKTSPRTNQEILTHMDDCLTNAKEFLRKQNGIGYHSLNQSGVSFGKAYYEQGIYKSAEDVFRRVLEFSDVHRGHQHPDTLQALHNLAMVCHSQGSHAEAEVLYKKSLEGRETRSEGDHLGTLQTIEELANVYCSQGRYADAGQLYHNVVESYKTQLGDGHPDSLKAILRLANNFRSQGDYSKAELLYQQAMKGLELCFGSNHPDLLCAVDDFGNNFQSQGRYAEAETLYLRALHGREMQLGRDHPDTQWTVANLANNYRSQGRYDEAESLYHRALVCNETQLGHDHPETLWIMDGLAAVYHAQCRYSEAETLFNRVLVCRERRLGCHHHNTLRTVNNLANVYHSQKLYAKAEELLRKSLDGREKHLGYSHPKTLGTVEDLATNLQCQGKLIEAATLFERTLKGRKELLSYNHPETLRTANKLLGLYRTQGRDTDVQLLTNEFPLLMERKEAPAMP